MAATARPARERPAGGRDGAGSARPAAAPAAAPVAASVVVRLQRLVGNRATGRLLAGSGAVPAVAAPIRRLPTAVLGGDALALAAQRQLLERHVVPPLVAAMLTLGHPLGWDRFLPASDLGAIDVRRGAPSTGRRARVEPALAGAYPAAPTPQAIPEAAGADPAAPSPSAVRKAVVGLARARLIEQVSARLDRVAVPTATGRLAIKRGAGDLGGGYAFRSGTNAAHADAAGRRGNAEHRAFLRAADVETAVGGAPTPRQRALWPLFREVILKQEGDTAAINAYDRQIVTVGAGYSARAGAAGRVYNRMPAAFHERLFGCGIRVEADDGFAVLDLRRGAVERGDNALRLIQTDERRLGLLIELAQSTEAAAEDGGEARPLRAWMLGAQFEEFVRRNRDLPEAALAWEPAALAFAVKLKHWAGALDWGAMGRTDGDVTALAELAVRTWLRINPKASEVKVRAKVRGIAGRTGVRHLLEGV